MPNVRRLLSAALPYAAEFLIVFVLTWLVLTGVRFVRISGESGVTPHGAHP